MSPLKIDLYIIGFIFLLTPFTWLIALGNLVNKWALSFGLIRKFGTVKMPVWRKYLIKGIGVCAILAALFLR